MLAFRKLFLVLALVSLTALGASAANVPALQCVANAGVPPIVRAEGLAELVGDLVLNCTGGFPAGSMDGATVTGPAVIPQVNVQIFLNTNITSKLTNDPGSEALLMIDEPVPVDQRICGYVSAVGTTCLNNNRPGDPGNVYKPVNGNNHTETAAYNIWQARQVGANSLVWLGVPIDAPGTNFTRIIRITNVRANANMLGVSSTLVPTQIVMYISITGSTSVPINNPQQTVAWIQNGLSFSVRAANGDSGGITFAQCKSQNSDSFGDVTASGACVQNRLRFAEGFATAFKTRFADGPGPDTSLDQNSPGSIFNMSESGFFTKSNSGWNGLDGLNPTGDAGVASQGTRLRVVFNNVPAGIRLFVTLQNRSSSSTNRGQLIQLVQGTSNGDGNYVVMPKVATTASGCSDLPGLDFAEVPTFGGTGTAVWEVINTDPLSIQTMDFGLVTAYSSNPANNVPALGTMTANGMFAPVSTTTTASAIAPVPRFVDGSSAKTVITINQCVSNLLFPFVTQQAGFDTGMVISNTSKDPYGTGNQAGTCTINYYGNTNGGVGPTAQTTGVVNAGDHVAWTLFGGGTNGVTATPGFQGYVIAQCKFQWAHGYAFISDLGSQKFAQGYLALILDQGQNTRFTNTGETLGN